MVALYLNGALHKDSIIYTPKTLDRATSCGRPGGGLKHLRDGDQMIWSTRRGAACSACCCELIHLYLQWLGIRRDTLTISLATHIQQLLRKPTIGRPVDRDHIAICVMATT
jgi:hypothetical protein